MECNVPARASVRTVKESSAMPSWLNLYEREMQCKFFLGARRSVSRAGRLPPYPSVNGARPWDALRTSEDSAWETAGRWLVGRGGKLHQFQQGS
jgi:hypothetical protein